MPSLIPESSKNIYWSVERILLKHLITKVKEWPLTNMAPKFNVLVFTTKITSSLALPTEQSDFGTSRKAKTSIFTEGTLAPSIVSFVGENGYIRPVSMAPSDSGKTPYTMGPSSTTTSRSGFIDPSHKKEEEELQNFFKNRNPFFPETPTGADDF